MAPRGFPFVAGNITSWAFGGATSIRSTRNGGCHAGALLCSTGHGRSHSGFLDRGGGRAVRRMAGRARVRHAHRASSCPDPGRLRHVRRGPWCRAVGRIASSCRCFRRQLAAYTSWSRDRGRSLEGRERDPQHSRADALDCSAGPRCRQSSPARSQPVRPSSTWLLRLSAGRARFARGVPSGTTASSCAASSAISGASAVGISWHSRRPCSAPSSPRARAPWGGRR